MDKYHDVSMLIEFILCIIPWALCETGSPACFQLYKIILKLVVCILLRVLGQVQGFRLTQHWFEYFI
jgi:hypothetical protein